MKLRWWIQLLPWCIAIRIFRWCRIEPMVFRVVGGDLKKCWRIDRDYLIVNLTEDKP